MIDYFEQSAHMNRASLLKTGRCNSYEGVGKPLSFSQPVECEAYVSSLASKQTALLRKVSAAACKCKALAIWWVWGTHSKKVT